MGDGCACALPTLRVLAGMAGSVLLIFLLPPPLHLFPLLPHRFLFPCPLQVLFLPPRWLLPLPFHPTLRPHRDHESPIFLVLHRRSDHRLRASHPFPGRVVFLPTNRCAPCALLLREALFHERAAYHMRGFLAEPRGSLTRRSRPACASVCEGRPRRAAAVSCPA